MTDKKVFIKIKSALHEALQKIRCPINMDTDFQDDLGMDDSEKRELFIYLEDEFDVMIEEDDIDGINVIEDLIRVIQSKQ